MRLKSQLISALCLISLNLFSQSEQKEIRLLDLETAMPIVRATFEYGEQNGISDENGIIWFSYKEGQSMRLSHINYGSWTLDEKALKKAIEEEFYYRESVAMNLYPVTVIGIKGQNEQPDEQIKIKYAERMEHDGAQILNQLPAFNSIRKGGNYGFDPVFRGFKYDQLNVVLNGVQGATAACPNRMDPPISQMAPNMMDRIEILKGPYALRYGMGFGATINFIPAKLRFSAKPDVYGRVSAGYESNGEIARGESQIGFSGAKHDLSFFGSWSKGDDYSSGSGEIIQAGFERSSFGAELGFKIASNQQIRTTALYNRARDADFPALPMDLREDDTWLFNVRHDIQINKGILKSLNTAVFGSFVDHLMDNLLKTIDPRMLNAETYAKTYNYGGRTEGVWMLKKGILYTGMDVKMEGAAGTRVREYLAGPNADKTFTDNAWQDGSIGKMGLFAEYQVKGEYFKYIFSGRLELNHAGIHDPGEEFTQVHSELNATQVNSGLSVGILMKSGSSLNTGLWLGRVQRSGSMTERFVNFFPVGLDPYEMLGNPQIAPEINNQLDITFNWMPGERNAVSIDIFASYLQDYISSVIDPDLSPRLPMSPGVRQYINIDKAFKSGCEITLSQKIFTSLYHQLAIAYTYGEDMKLSEPLPEIAPLDLRYSFSGSYFDDKLRPELMFRYVSEQSRVSDEFGESVTPSFSLLDFRVEYQITQKFGLKAGVNNILDENYYEHLSRLVKANGNPVFAPGRSFFASVNVSF